MHVTNEQKYNESIHRAPVNVASCVEIVFKANLMTDKKNQLMS